MSFLFCFFESFKFCPAEALYFLALLTAVFRIKNNAKNVLNLNTQSLEKPLKNHNTEMGKRNKKTNHFAQKKRNAKVS